MDRSIIATEDGSSSIYVPALGEHYHSHFGAIQESQHIFIDAALARINKNQINILEFGFGTGLNALLAYQYAKEKSKELRYYSLEKYPLVESEYQALNYASADVKVFFSDLHHCEWEQWNRLNSTFEVFKKVQDFRAFRSVEMLFDVVFFDAFAPDVQPKLWNEELFQQIYDSMTIGGIFMTYTVKGSVRRMLKACGFVVEKIPGPIGKREITRAFKR